MTVRLVLDTDIGSDVDDALALAFALRHPGIDLRAVTTVSGDTRRRGHIARKLLRLAGREDVEVAAGLHAGEPRDGRSPWRGDEGKGLLGPGETLPLSDRDAVTLLLDETRDDHLLEVATVGMQTNIAAAVERDEDFPARLHRLAVMGGVFPQPGPAEERFTPTDDHNLNCDPDAAVRSLNAGIPTLYTPGNVTVQTYLTSDHLERLRRGDDLCQALAALTDVWTPVLRRSAPDLPAEHVAVLHDPLTVACMVDRRFVEVDRMPVTVALHDGIARTFVDPLSGDEADVITAVDAEGFVDFWLGTVMTA